MVDMFLNYLFHNVYKCIVSHITKIELRYRSMQIYLRRLEKKKYPAPTP